MTPPGRAVGDPIDAAEQAYVPMHGTPLRFGGRAGSLRRPIPAAPARWGHRSAPATRTHRTEVADWNARTVRSNRGLPRAEGAVFEAPPSEPSARRDCARRVASSVA